MKAIGRIALLPVLAAFSASGAEPVYFAASWGPYLVAAILSCTTDGCAPSARLEVRELTSMAGAVRCASAIEGFPKGVVLKSKWVEVHGEPVLVLNVAPTELGPAIEYTFQPELDCTYTATWLSLGKI